MSKYFNFNFSIHSIWQEISNVWLKWLKHWSQVPYLARVMNIIISYRNNKSQKEREMKTSNWSQISIHILVFAESCIAVASKISKVKNENKDNEKLENDLKIN